MLLTISVNSSLIPIIFYLIFFKRNKGERLWVIPLYTLCGYFTDIINVRFGRPPQDYVTTFFASTFFTFIEGTLFGIFLYPLIKNRISKIFMIVLYLLNLAYGAISVITTTDYANADNSFSFTSAEEFSIIVLCIFYFYEQLNNPDVTFIYETKQFWIITAFFFVTVATLSLFASVSLLGEKTTTFWPISQTATILKNFLLVIALLRRPDLKLAR